MADIFGSDIAQTTNGDWQSTANSDVAIVSGPANLQQALERRWRTRVGALFYAPDYGNPVYDMMSEPITPDWITRATASARTCLMGDSRVADVQVTVTPNPQARTVAFACVWKAADGSTGRIQDEVTVGV